jgi:hypothetical protein
MPQFITGRTKMQLTPGEELRLENEQLPDKSWTVRLEITNLTQERQFILMNWLDEMLEPLMPDHGMN